jgi:hypothetical protein
VTRRNRRPDAGWTAVASAVCAVFGVIAAASKDIAPAAVLTALTLLLLCASVRALRR